MAKLTEQLKRFIVMELAVGSSPSEVVARLHEEFGVEVTRQQVHKYDPTKADGGALSKGLAKLYHDTRKAREKAERDIHVASRTYRLMRLDQGVRHGIKIGNWVLVANLLAQAAKEMGGSFTNQHRLAGADGKNLPATPAVVILPAKDTTEGANGRAPGRKAKT